MSERLPPYCPESEEGVLACILSDPATINLCVESLVGGASGFYDLRNRTLYEAMLSLHHEGKPVDLVTVQSRLRSDGILESVGGLGRLAALQNSIPSAANLPYYSEVMNEKAVLRRVIQVCTEGIESAYNAADATETLDALERAILAIRPNVSRNKKTTAQLVQSAVEVIERLWHQKGALTGTSTGLIDLDKKTGGLVAGEVTVLAGFPGSGKTSLAMNIAERAMLEDQKTVGVFSLEMSGEALVTRFICSHARVNLRNLGLGFVTDRDFLRMRDTVDAIGKARIWFEDDSDMSIYQLRAKARRHVQQEGRLDLIVVDYLQLLTAAGGSRKLESRQQEVADISRGIKAMARELNAAVLSLSQLNDDGKLRESRAIGQDADNVWILQPPKEDDSESDSVKVDLEVAKARNGPRGKVPLLFRKAFTRFVNAAKSEPDNQQDFLRKDPYKDS